MVIKKWKNKMNTLEIQKLVKEKGFSAIQTQFKLDMKQDDDFTLLKYQQTNSPLGSISVQQCRGIIFDTETKEVVAFPFVKFPNLKENHRIDFSKFTVREKTDGTMITLWFSTKLSKWIVSTSGSLYAENNTGLGTGDLYHAVVSEMKAQNIEQSWKLGSEKLSELGCKTISELFFDVASELNMNIDALDENKTYVFELATEFNQVVNSYDSNVLKLLMVRDINTFKEEKIDVHAENLKVQTPTKYEFSSINEMAPK